MIISLFIKIVAIMGLYGACRPNELYKLESSYWTAP